MTQPYNALYGPPQAPVDNALYYDDTQGMPRQRPADPLRWLADAVGQNKDLPAPQFFMDPRALSARNMLYSALNTSANWLDGTRDPSRIGPEEMVSPFGLGIAGSMGTGVKNAMTRPGRDFRIAEAMAREHPGASAVGDIPRFAPLRDASNPTSAARVADYGSVPGARAPVNTNRTPSEEIARAYALADESKARTAALADETKRIQDDIRSPEIKTDQRTLNMLRELDAMWRQPKYDETVRPFPFGGKGGPRGLMADNAKGSAPGTVINSLDMSEAARMQRAREMGFDMDTPLYHGTKADFDEFLPSEKGKFGAGVYFSPKREFADEWTSGNGRVIEAYGRGRMAGDSEWKAAMDAEYKANPSRSMFDVEVAAGERLQREGFDGVASKARGETVVFNPSHIRSTQAAFDPAKRDSAMLLAADNAKGSAPGTVVNSMAPKEVVADYVKRLNDTFRDPDQFPAVMKELEADPRVTQAEAVQIASEFYAPIAGSTSRPKALQHAMKRHEKLMESRRASGTIGKLTADNAKGSAPGTVVNSLADDRTVAFVPGGAPGIYKLKANQDGQEIGRATLFFDGNKSAYLEDVSVPKHLRRNGIASKIYDEAQSFAEKRGAKFVPSPDGQLGDGLSFWVNRDPDLLMRTLESSRKSASPGDVGYFDDAIKRATELIQGSKDRDIKSSPYASAPGLAANSTQQQDDQGVMSILRRYGLAD